MNEDVKKGVKIGEWTLVRQLNVGGMGQVWQASKVFVTGDKRVAAIKLLRPSGVLDRRMRESLLTEAGIQMKLQHPNIPKVIDVGVHEGLPYLAMDYISGRDLSQLMSRVRDQGTYLDPTVAAHIAREVAYALHYAHTFEVDGVSEELVHRDMASKNVMIDGRGGVFVLDFGVAEARSHKSSSNHVKGTLLYMAPEQGRGFPCQQSDAWGLGTVLWEMLENRVFRSEVDPKDLRGVVDQGWVPPLTKPGIPDVLRFIVEGLLRKNPDDRLTIVEVMEHLESPDFPAQRQVLAGVMFRGFGAAVLASGQTLHDFNISDELDQAIVAGRVAKNSPLLVGPSTWAQEDYSEAFIRAGAPPVVGVSKTRPIVPPALKDDEDSRELEVVEPAEKASETEADEEAVESEEQGVPLPPVPTEILTPFVAGAAEVVATTDRLEPLTSRPEIVMTTERLPSPRPSPDPAPKEDSVPIARLRGGTAPAAAAFLPGQAVVSRSQPAVARPRHRGITMVLLVLLLGVGVVGVWALASGGSQPEADSVVSAVVEPSVEAIEFDIPSEDAPLPEFAEPEPEAEAEAEAEPEPEPEPEEPKKVKKQPAVRRSRLYLALGFIQAMEVRIGGIRRSLRAAGPDRATIAIKPGRKTVRWRRPGEPWSPSKRVTIEEGKDYKVMLDGRGVTIEAKREKKR